MKKHVVVGLGVAAAVTLAGCSSQKSSATSYKDGSYDVTGNYVSPGGPEEIEVKVTLKNNVITSADVISKAQRTETQHYQGIFIDNYKPLVVGKNINEVNLSKVSGSSLTPQGFNDAISKIKVQAKV